ncbi:MAG: HIT domain-containing protein [Planctomycetes bacterium]|nr:HIT domain-containing protein [Planctomycetota bacterium]
MVMPASIFFETDEVIVIADIHPKAPVHLLIIPKAFYPDFYSAPPEILALLDQTAKQVAEKLGVTNHFRIIVNNGFGQEVDHIHYHFLSDRGIEKLRFLK